MKFISKYSNYRIILRQGIPGNVALGTPTVSSISVLFQDNIAEVNDEKYIKMMLEHPRFGDDNSADFIIMKEDESNAMYKTGKGIEPEHNIVEMNNSAIGKVINPKKAMTISDDQKKYMEKMIKEKAMVMAAEIVKKEKSEIDGGDISTPLRESNVAQKASSITVNSPIKTNRTDERLTAPLPEADTKAETIAESEEELIDEFLKTETTERENKVGGIEMSKDNGGETVRIDESKEEVVVPPAENKKKIGRPGRPKNNINNKK